GSVNAGERVKVSLQEGQERRAHRHQGGSRRERQEEDVAGYFQAGEIAPARSRQHGAHASATRRTEMFGRVGLRETVSRRSVRGSVPAPSASASALNSASSAAMAASTAATDSRARPT